MYGLIGAVAPLIETGNAVSLGCESSKSRFAGTIPVPCMPQKLTIASSIHTPTAAHCLYVPFGACGTIRYVGPAGR